LLSSLGWTPALEDEFAPHAADGFEPARVAVEHRGAYVVYTARGECPAELSGRLRHAAEERGDLPAVGDWVAVTPTEPAMVQAVLPRRTKFSRMAANDHGQTIEQVVAANVDVIFLTAGLDGDLNIRRLERYLTLGWESGADPVVVLTKSDLCDDVEAALYEVASVAIGVPVHAVSNVTGEGHRGAAPVLRAGRTVAALGSSGVGKSSLVNRLAGEELMAVGELRADGKGRHTTTNRQLLLLPAAASSWTRPACGRSGSGTPTRASRPRSTTSLRRRRSAGSTTARTRPSRTAASAPRSLPGRSTRSATSAGGSFRASCSTWR
jgi:ribosome biogenesis GTPase